MPKEAEERRGEAEAEASGDPVYSTKVVQFLGRTTPIVLQDENGPCPLLAVGNLLLTFFHIHSLILLEWLDTLFY